MKAPALLLLIPGAAAAAVAAAAAPAGCAADNCLRALRATQTPGRLAAARSFCAAYTATADAAAAATVPAYAAAACASHAGAPLEARLTSACACIGEASSTVGSSTSVASSSSSVASSTVASTSSSVASTSVASTSTSPSSVSSASPSPSGEPCALASSAWAAFTAASPSALPTIAPELARACLESAPLDAEAAVALVDALEPYLEWQSDAAYKAKPPADYYPPAYDLFAELAAVRANVLAGAYAGEHAFQLDLYLRVFGPGHDGHMVYYPDLLTSVFDYGHGVVLVSVSDAAASGVPQIKLLDDVRAAGAAAPAVVQIDGEPADQVVLRTADRASYDQDGDAGYNGMFYTPALAGGPGSIGSWARGGRIRFVYPGPTTNYTFSNGSTLTVANEAYVRAPLTGVTDGASLFARFCAGALSPNGKAYKANSTTSGAAAAFSVPGYPAPVYSTRDGQASCYFLDGAGYEDVAVVALLSFEPDEPAEFQYVVHACLNEAHDHGRTRLILDMSANGGGFILLGYDLFRQLFPAVQEDGISRWKENGGFTAVARVVSALTAHVDPATSADGTAVGLSETVFSARHDLDVAGRPFASFGAKFDPHDFADTPYTANMRWDLNDPLATYNYTYGLRTAVSGYGPLANLTAPARDDLVLLYDGYCASTCTIASEMLRLQGGVRSIALGGRPATAGQPMQGVGGIKGAQVYEFRNIYGFVAEARYLLESGAVDLGDDDLTNTTLAALARYSDLPLRRATAASVNVRDQILRPDLADGLPAQYVREDADCRLYYTADMVTDVTASWRAAADAAFHGAACAAGSAAAPAANSKRTQPVVAERAADHAAQNLTAVYKAQADAGFRPKDLPEDERARFNAEFNQKVVV